MTTPPDEHPPAAPRAADDGRAQEILGSGADHLSASPELATTLQGIAAAARSALGADRATCYAYQIEDQTVSAVYTTEDDPRRRAFLARAVGLGAGELPIWRIQLLQEDPLLVIGDVTMDPRIPEALASRLGSGAIVGVRLEHQSVRTGDEPALLGTLFCSYSAPRRFSGSECLAARGLANLAALALANARLQAETALSLESNRALTDEQAALRRVATLVAAETDPHAVFAQVAEEVAGLLGVDCGLVARFEAQRALPVGWWGADPPSPGSGFPLDDDSALARVAGSGGVVRLDDDTLVADGPAGEVAFHSRYRSGVAAPVRVGGRLWGALLAATTARQAIDSRAEERLERFAELVAFAIANTEARARLAAQAATDPLTGLANHRTFFERLHADVERARRHDRSLAMILIDLDHFKRVNDGHGHQVGDRVLVEVADRLSRLTRAEDTLARVGGEEFAWLLPETDDRAALAAAERARRTISSRPFDEVGRMTISAGVAELRAGPNDLFRAADAALYWAKGQGRDLCAVSRPEHEQALVGPSRSASDLSAGVGRMLAMVREQLGLPLAVVGEFTAGDYVFRHLDGDSEAFGLQVGARVPLIDTYCQRMVDGRIPGLIRDAARDEHVRELDRTASLGIGAYVGVPIERPGGELYGALCCLSHDPEPGLGAGDMRLMRIVAGLIGEELEREERAGRTRASERESILRVIDGSGLQIVMQPIVELDGGRVVAAEALSRFAHEPRRPPDAWFAAAEAADLGVELELAAVGAALERIGLLPAHARLSLNLSPATLCSPALAEMLAGTPGSRLALELTEHAPVEDYSVLASSLAGLRSRGVQLMIDDAGAGFASLRHVLGLHPDVIKLDLSLTRDVDTDPVRRALAASLVAFAREVGALIVAEGIETPTELDALRGLGVGLGQGYLIGRPDTEPVPGAVDLGRAAAEAGAVTG